jgi:hypothetical protein
MLDFPNKSSAQRSPSLLWQDLPNWYVTNGEKVVGPVSGNLLLRGILHGRISRDCYVAQHRWSNWRAQGEIREIASLRRWQRAARILPEVEPLRQALKPPHVDTSALELIHQRESLVARALELALSSTQANVGIVHRPRPPHVGLVTSWAKGPGMALNLGEVVPWHDDARIVACEDRALLGRPEQDGWARSSARRLSTGSTRVAGVALLSVEILGARGLIELGRYDHPFRANDLPLLEDVRDSISLRLTQLKD